MVDQSSLEVSAALTAFIASGAAVLSLASVIRKANGFDARDKAFKTSTITATTVPAAVTIQEIVAQKIEEPVMKKETPVEVVAAKKEVAPTTPAVAKAPVAASTSPIKVEPKKVEQKPIAPTPVIAAATSAPAIKKTEMKIEEVISPLRDAKPAEVKVGEPILFNFEENTPEAISMISEDDDVATTRVTEPTLPKADPAVAAAVLDAMTADAPVGITTPGANTGGSSIPTPTPEEPVLELVGAIAAPTSAAEAMEAAREYEARLARVIADAKMDTATVSATESATSQKRLVTITDQYQEKIDALWASYEVKKTQEAVLLSKQEKLTMDLAALDAAQQAQEEAVKAESKLTMVAQKSMAAIAAIWVFIMALVAKVTGGRFGNTPAGASA